jgi:hypothetical protein
MSWVHDPDNALYVGGSFKDPARDPVKGYFGDTIKPGQRVIFITGGSGFCINTGTYIGVIRRLPSKHQAANNKDYKIEEYVIQLDDKSRTRLHYNRIFPDTLQLSDLFNERFS